MHVRKEFDLERYDIGLYEKAMPATLTWEEKLACAKECGYDFVEISIDETDERLARLDWTEQERMDLVRTMREQGVPIRSMCLSGHRKYPFGATDASVRARSMEIMEKAIQLADDLGIRIIQLAGYDVYYEEGTDETKRMYCAYLFPGVTPEMVQENTGFEIDCSRAEQMEGPSPEIIRLIREEIDPGQAFIKVPKE